MAEARRVLRMERNKGPRFGLDTDGITAGGVFRLRRWRDEAIQTRRGVSPSDLANHAVRQRPGRRPAEGRGAAR